MGDRVGRRRAVRDEFFFNQEAISEAQQQCTTRVFESRVENNSHDAVICWWLRVSGGGVFKIGRPWGKK